MEKNKKFMFVAFAAVTLVTGIAMAFTCDNSSLLTVNYVYASECSHHSGNHYLAKEPTIDDPGWVEFWACCKCGHQYVGEAPEGDWVTQDPANMIGVVQEGHIAYIPPLNEGGENGDYWGKDPF